ALTSSSKIRLSHLPEMTMVGKSLGKNFKDCDGKVAGKSQRKVGLIYDETMCKHDTPDGEVHVECPDRIRVIWEKLQLAGVTQRCVVLGGSKAEDKHLQLVHTKKHVNLVKRITTKQKDHRRNRTASQFDSIYLNGGSSEAAYLAAGSVLKVVEKVAQGELDCGFAIVRPPGHHAEAGEAMGFCLFNNVAVAASYLLNQRPDLGFKKILIVDWDIHHGNGTQKMFWKDPRVLVFSVHRHDHGSFYPSGDDGDYNMVGEGPGEGFNINVPWEQGGCGDADYLVAWDHILIPVLKEYNPDIILLSAGFDAAIGDPLGGCCVTPYGYSVMLKKLMEFAQGKIVLALEGGYNLESMAMSSLACVQVLLEEKPIQCSSGTYPLESTRRVIQVENRELRYTFSAASDSLMASNENLKNLSAERNSADAVLHTVEELKSLLAARDGELEARRQELNTKTKELEARLILDSARAKEIHGLRAKIESLMREKDEAVATAERLDKKLQENRSRSRLKNEDMDSEDEDMDSEDLEPDLETMSQELKKYMHLDLEKFKKDYERYIWELKKERELAITAARQGTLSSELKFAADVYHKLRSLVEKGGKSHIYCAVEVYEEEWKKIVIPHHKPKSPVSRGKRFFPNSHRMD
ncbi:hypothetical protein CARUB_v10028344mg, partial [Capsella rubella]